MHRSRLCFAAVLAVLPFLAGCFESKVKIDLKKDGSGTITHTEYTKLPDFGLSEADKQESAQRSAEEKAAQLGEGVTVDSVKVLKPKGKGDDQMQGTTVVYAFTDISKLKLDPRLSTSSAGGAPGGDADEKKQEPLTFQFTPGDQAKLEINMPMIVLGGGKKPDNEFAASFMEGMMESTFKGAQAEFIIEFEGQVTESNAAFLSKNKKSIGVMSANLDGITKNKAALKAFVRLDPADRESMKKSLAAAPLNKFLRIETQEKITVTFK